MSIRCNADEHHFNQKRMRNMKQQQRFWRGWIIGVFVLVTLIGCATQTEPQPSSSTSTESAQQPKNKEETEQSQQSQTTTKTTPDPVATPPADVPIVVTSFYPMYEFTRQVAGTFADVQVLIGDGVDPHEWEPSAQQLVLLEKAQMLVYNGAGLEGWIEQVIGGINNPKLVRVETTQGLALLESQESYDHGHDHDHDHGATKNEKGHPIDPHVWLSPAKAIEQVRRIQTELTKQAPQYATTYQSNADAYVAQLTALDQKFQEQLKPYAGRTFVTQHASFSYLADAYGLKQLPIAGLSPEQEPSAAQMAKIVKEIKKNKVKTVYLETAVSSKIAETIAKETGATTAVLHPLEARTKAEIEAGDTYVSLMERNLQSLVAGFAL